MSRSCCGSRSSARATTSSGNCSRRAMLMPYERPGMPLMSRYVGASATASNCSDALTTPRTCVASSLSVPRCVVARSSCRARVSFSRIAQPSAAPSIGIGARSQLVDQHERVVRRQAQNLGEVLQVRAERRQARFDRLLVADVGERVVEHRRCDSPGRPARECPTAPAPR